MITVHSLDVKGIIFTGIQLNLPRAKIYIIMNDVGYIMSTSLAMQVHQDNWKKDKSIGGYVSNVQSVDELLQAPLEEITHIAKKKGWTIGMQGKEALLKIA